MYTDIHTHILHDVDDGPSTISEAIKLLELSVLEGTENIIATPHFYASHHRLKEHLELINSRFEELVVMAKQTFPNVNFILGMEVRYFNGISKSDVLELLCFKNTNTILLELGYEPINDKIIFEIKELYYNGFNVILAHIERYYKFKGFSKLKELIDKGFVKAQLSASALFEHHFKRATVKLIKDGYITFVASDMHSTEHRPPRLKEAFEFIKNKFGEDISIRFIKNSFLLFEDMNKREAEVKDVLF